MENNTGFKDNIERTTILNTAYRKTLYTTKQLQLVVMNIPIGGDINKEIHKNATQFIRVEEGNGVAYLNGKQYKLKDGDSIVIPSGTEHYIKNTSKNNSLKLYTVYSPPQHPDGLVERNKQEE